MIVLGHRKRVLSTTADPTLPCRREAPALTLISSLFSVFGPVRPVFLVQADGFSSCGGDVLPERDAERISKNRRTSPERRANRGSHGRRRSAGGRRAWFSWPWVRDGVLVCHGSVGRCLRRAWARHRRGSTGRYLLLCVCVVWLVGWVSLCRRRVVASSVQAAAAAEDRRTAKPL